jgi:hypothetical protein
MHTNIHASSGFGIHDLSLEQAKTVRALDRADTVIDIVGYYCYQTSSKIVSDIVFYSLMFFGM